MKIKKIIIMILALFGVVGFNTLNVNAAPSTITLKSKSNLYYYTEDKKTDYISGYNFYRKELTDGTFVYCVSNINTEVPAGKTLSLKGEITDLGLNYILTNGYPYSSFTGDAKKDYYITQAAIWEYFDETRGSNNWGKTTFTSSDTGMKAYVYKLVSNAKKASSSETASSSINIIVLNTNMSLEGSYYVSDPIRVNLDGTNGEYNVSLENAPENTIVKSTNGDIKSTFKNGEEFRVYVPASTKTSGSLKVKVTSKVTTLKTYEYSANKSRLQNIGLVVSETKEIESSLDLQYNVVVTKLKVSKQDITSKEELPGATLVIKDKDGNVVDTWVSTSTPHYIEGLKEGSYTLTETIAPKGYILSTSTINFTLERDGKVKEVVMYNSREEITKVSISKQDVTSKEELPGATLVIKDKDGNVVDTWVSTSTPHYIEGLKEGEYTLTETIAPKGYKLSEETIKFTLKADGTVTSVVMYNEKYNVPITDLNVSTTVIVGAALLMLLGTGLVFYAKRSH